MDARSVANAYRSSTIENAPPLKIIRLLYEGAIRHLDRAAAAGVEEPRPAFNESLTRADAIVTELRLALDHSNGTDVSQELERLYLFVEDCLARAMSHRELGPVQHARGVLATLLEAWVHIDVSQQAA
jgi:flagellar secretion chaperone FliS